MDILARPHSLNIVQLNRRDNRSSILVPMTNVHQLVSSVPFGACGNSLCRGPFCVFGDLSFFLEKQEERFSVPSIVVIDRLRQKEQCFPCTDGENLSRHIILEQTLDY